MKRTGLQLAACSLALISLNSACDGSEVGELAPFGFVEEGTSVATPDIQSSRYGRSLEDVVVGSGCSGVDCEAAVSLIRASSRMSLQSRRERAAFANVRTQQQSLTEYERETEEGLELGRDSCATSRDALIVATLFLEERPFDFTRLAEVRQGDSARRSEGLEALREERLAQLRPDLDRVRDAVEELGGTIIGRQLSANNVVVELPSCALEKATEFPGVLGLSIDGRDEPGTVEHPDGRPGVDGVERQVAMGISLGEHWAYRGGSGGSGLNGRIRFGVIESDNSLNTSHVAFQDPDAFGQSRIADTDRCTFWFPSSRCINSATTSGSSHGTYVTSALVGDLLGAHGGAYTFMDRLRGTSVARNAEVRYYSYEHRSHLATALDEATFEDSVDIVNISAAPSGEGYCQNDSLNGVRSAVRAATDAGLLIVVAAGNDGRLSGACTVNNYGAFPDTLAVGGTEGAASLSALDGIEIDDASGNGYFATTLNGGRTVAGMPVDLVTNYCHDALAHGGTTDIGDACGTSISSPVVAGVAGILYGWANARPGRLGGLETDALAMRTLLSLMGDGRAYPSGVSRTSVDTHFGFGNLRYVDLDTETGNGGWGLKRFWVDEGDVVEFSVNDAGPESTSVNGWKFAALIDDELYSGSPDVRFELIDTCPAGGGETLIRTASRRALKARMMVGSSEAAWLLHNRCLVVRATVEDASGPFNLYLADYYYQNDRSNHEAN